MASDIEIKVPETARKSVVLVLVAIAFIATTGLFFASLSYFKSAEIEDASARLTLYDRSLNDTLERFQHLPSVLARYPNVITAFAASSNTQLDKQFASIAQEAVLEAIYLMDQTGLVLSASNHNTPQTFIGQNYAFRPYFKTALSGKRGEFFGIGATTGRPGYFVSEPVFDPSGSISGVIAIKLDMSELQKAWKEGGERVFVSNSDGIIVLSSDSSWLYQTLVALSPSQQDSIKAGKQFGDRTLTSFDWKLLGSSSVSIKGESYIHVSADAKRLGWTVHYLLGERRVFERATLTTIIFGVALSILLAFTTFLRSVRIEAALRASQADRQHLRAANSKLSSAQKELARTSKLAALGQLSAFVTHELGQPISAMRNYLAAAELDGGLKSGATSERLNKVVDRMENITRQLRFFTKPGEEKLEEVTLQDVFTSALGLVEHDINIANITLKTDIANAPVIVHGNRLRLEQVLVNLMKNSLAAMETSEEPVLSITVSKQSGNAFLRVKDTGIGFGDRKLPQLQEPFHTTRASGDGMGLGLSITSAIIKEHDGTLTAHSLEDGGACFEMSLPLTKGGN